jgi:hypothetical protein
MRGFKFREPLMIDPSGLYITAAQLAFYLNRPEGKSKFDHADPDFMSYYHNCCIYNFVYDMMLEDEECASLFWDDKNNCVSMSYPAGGKVSRAISDLSNFIDDEDGDWDDDDDEFDENPWGLFE